MNASTREHIYGDSNGAMYTDHSPGDHDLPHKTHWDPRLSIECLGSGMVQIGIVPPSDESTDSQGVWDTEQGQFMTLSRDGLNRLIRAARACRDTAFGADE